MKKWIKRFVWSGLSEGCRCLFKLQCVFSKWAGMPVPNRCPACQSFHPPAYETGAEGKPLTTLAALNDFYDSYYLRQEREKRKREK